VQVERSGGAARSDPSSIRHVEIPTRVEQMRLPKYTGDDSYEMPLRSLEKSGTRSRSKFFSITANRSRR